MKKVTLSIIFLVLSYFVQSQTIQDIEFGTDSTFEVMTWNIEWFPKNGQTTLDYVSQIIEAVDVDVIAIQEVDDTTMFKQMVGSLNGYEGYFKSSWFAGLAYIYKTNSIQINSIYEIYTTSQYWNAFPRSPMVMELTYNGKEIIVINNHFKCCGDGVLNTGDSSDEENRRYMASNLLKQYIDSHFSNKKVITVGDLNDILTDSQSNNVFQSFLDDTANYRFADMIIEQSSSSNWSYPTWPSQLDHILITDEIFNEYENNFTNIKTIKVDDYLSGGWTTYDDNISDHRPVALKITPITGIGIADVLKPTMFINNYPNPFSDFTKIGFSKTTIKSKLEIVDINGNLIYFTNINIGQNSAVWNAKDISNGVYIAKLTNVNSALYTKIFIAN